MITETALLAAILDNPTDDSPRLIFADFLDENGQEERGEFIRIQIALKDATDCPAWCPGPDGCETALLRHRAKELTAMWWVHWAFGPPITSGGWPMTLVGGWGCENISSGHYQYQYLTFQRGFVETIHCTVGDLTRCGSVLVASQPIRVIHLTDVKERIEIVPPGIDHDWQAYAYRDGVEDYYTMHSWETRAEMIRGVQIHYRRPETFEDINAILHRIQNAAFRRP